MMNHAHKAFSIVPILFTHFFFFISLEMKNIYCRKKFFEKNPCLPCHHAFLFFSFQAHISCLISAKPEPRVSWTRDGLEIGIPAFDQGAADDRRRYKVREISRMPGW